MNLKETIAAKKAELADLKERIEANDAEAIEQGTALKAEIESKEAELKQAEEKTALLETIGKKTEEDISMSNSEERAIIKADELAALKENRGTVSASMKAYNDAEVTTTIYDYDRNPVDARPALGVRDLFGAEAISGNALTYYVLSAAEGTIDGTAEGAAKDRIHIPYTAKTAALTKIAAYLKESDELLSDAAFLESAIRNRGVYEIDKAIESYLVSALAGTTGVQVYGTAITFDNILAAKQDIIADTGYTPDAMIINPADWATLLQSKDNNNQYLLGGPGFGSYGNGGYFANPKVWGMTVIESAAVTEGNVIVGAFKAGASVVTKAGEGQRVEVSNSDQDDFIKNMVTVRFEERLVEAVRVPAAFCIVGADESGS